MSIKTLIERRDDIDGSANAEPFYFGVGEKMYRIDLAPKHSVNFKRAIAAIERRLERYITNAEEVEWVEKRNSTKTPKYSATPSEHQTKLIKLRNWADENNIEVPRHGRIPQEVWQDFADYEKSLTQENTDDMTE